MQRKQPIVEAIVIPFIAPPCPSAELSARDRLEIQAFRQFARENGYDRLTVHEGAHGDAPELGSYLAIYRLGEPWSTWSVTREGARITAWNSVTGVDAGPFTSMTAALSQLLGRQMPPVRHAARPAKPHPRTLQAAAGLLSMPQAQPPNRASGACHTVPDYPCRYARTCLGGA